MSMFASLIGQLEKKKAGLTPDEELARLIERIRLTGKPGKLTLTLTLRPKDNDGSLVDVSQRITVAAPELASKSALFFTTTENTLSRTDPAQKELEFEAVPGGRADTQPEPAAIAAVQ